MRPFVPWAPVTSGPLPVIVRTVGLGTQRHRTTWKPAGKTGIYGRYCSRNPAGASEGDWAGYDRQIRPADCTGTPVRRGFAKHQSFDEIGERR